MVVKKYMNIIILYYLFSIEFGYGQTKPATNVSLTSRIQQQANIMGEAFLKSDYITFAKYTYPALLNAMGGENKMASTLSQTINDMYLKGMSFSSIYIDDPSKIVKNHNELQCTLQQHTTIKLANGRVITTSTLIAVSEDGGNDWYFIDTSNKDGATIRKVMPNLSNAIIIPIQQKPIFYNN